MERRGGLVARRAMLRVDLEAPRKRRRLPEELLIPPVAEPPDPLREQQPGSSRVHEAEDAVAGPPDDHRAGEAAEEDSAPDAEPALPDGERRPPRVDRLHLVPRRDVVVQARADDSEADAPDRDAEDEIPVAALPDPTHAGEPDAPGDAEEQHQPVHTDRQRPDVEDPGARRGNAQQHREDSAVTGRPVRRLRRSLARRLVGARPLEKDLERELLRTAVADEV